MTAPTRRNPSDKKYSNCTKFDDRRISPRARSAGNRPYPELPKP
jgi:hypothetical protein